MSSPYRLLLLALLPAVGCPLPDDTGKTETGVTTESETGCITVSADTTECPAAEDVDPSTVTPATCGAEVVSVDGEGTLGKCSMGGFKAQAGCTYPITIIPPEEECAYGRPLVLHGAPVLAALARRSDWAAGRAQGGDGAAASAGERPARAAAWARAALAEHASVASFARFTLELLAVGAPADLVAAAQAAAQDEVRHAQLAFGLASRFGGAPVGPAPLALDGLALDADLARLAAAAVREGCVAETLSALQVAAARDLVEDAEEKAVLAVLARDEARHAALAWRFVRWALDQEGEGTPDAPGAVRQAVVAAFAAASAGRGGSAADDGGLLPQHVAGDVASRGWAEVIAPAAAALLSQGAARAARTAPPAPGAVCA